MSSAMMVEAVKAEPYDLATILACADAFEEEGNDDEAQKYRKQAVEVTRMVVPGVMVPRVPVEVGRRN